MDRLSVLILFSWQYLVMAYLACLGVVQLAAARSQRRHLWLLRTRRATMLLGGALLIAGVAFFYLVPLWASGPWGPIVDGSASWGRATPGTLSGARNVNETAGGLTGSWQALYFSVGWITAVLTVRLFGRRRHPAPAGDTRRDEPKPVGAGSGDRR